MSRYARGQEVAVYDDARRPHRAVVQPGGAERAAVVMAAALWLLVLWRYAGRRTVSARRSEPQRGAV